MVPLILYFDYFSNFCADHPVIVTLGPIRIYDKGDTIFVGLCAVCAVHVSQDLQHCKLGDSSELSCCESI